MSIHFGEIRQIAFVVTDIDEAMAHWSEDLGIGPFHIKRQIRFDPYLYRGIAQPSPTVSIALSNSGPLQIELIQQHCDSDSIYREFLSARRGLQHIAAWTDRAGFDERRADLLGRGYAIAQECTIPASGVRLCYFDTESEDTPIFELADLLEPAQAPRIGRIRDDAAHWDGQLAVIEVDR